MSDSLQSWISQYLIDVAETHGANLTAIPYFAKKKKVQLVEFITYDLNSQDDCIWGRVSDKQYNIPVRFTKEAMSKYNSLNARRITEHKTALISITDFQPFFARIPLANKKGMSKTACLALNIKAFSIIGSTGEAQWGRPQDIEMNADLFEWCEGLRKDGGEGNVLMNRKREREKSVGPAAPLVKPRKVGSPTKNRAHVSKASRSKTIERTAVKVVGADLLKEYEKSWRPISLNAWAYTLKPLKQQPQTISGQENIISDRIMEHSPVRPQSNEHRLIPRRHALDLASSQPERKTPTPEHSSFRKYSPRHVPTTPSDWSPSAHGSQIARDWPEDEAASEHEHQQEPLSAPSPEGDEQPGSPPRDDSALPNTFTTENLSHPSPPTPAQRPKLLPSSPFPPPPAPFPSRTPGAEFLSTPRQDIPIYTRRKVMRKVPHPAQPPPKSSVGGPAHILAPNSDTSGTASQPHSQSQPVTQSSQIPVLPHVQDEPVKQQSYEDNGFRSMFAGDGYNGTKASSQSIAVQDVIDLRPRPRSPYGDDADADVPTNVSISTVPESLSQMITSDGNDSEDDIKDKEQSEGDEDQVDELQADELQEDELQADELQEDELQEDELRDDELQEDGLQEDGPQENVLQKDGLQEEGIGSPIQHTSIVPDLQGGQLDDDDAQMDEMLFGLFEASGSDAGSVRCWPTARAPTDGSTNDQTTDVLHCPADDTSDIPKNHVQSPLPKMPSSPGGPRGSTKAEQPVSSNNISPPNSVPPDGDIHLVEHSKTAWATPSFMHDKKGKDKECASPLEITDRQKRSLIGENKSSSRTSTPTINLLNGGIDGGKVTVGQPSSSSGGSHIHTKPRPVSDIYGKSRTDTTTATRALASGTTASGRESSGSMKNDTRSHKRPRESSTEGRIDMKQSAAKRRRLADTTLQSGPSSSRQSLEIEGAKAGEVGWLRPMQDGGNGHDDIKDKPLSEPGQFTGRMTLNGFQVNFHNILCEDQNWPFGWEDLQQVLLQTGRKRIMEQRRKAA